MIDKNISLKRVDNDSDCGILSTMDGAVKDDPVYKMQGERYLT